MSINNIIESYAPDIIESYAPDMRESSIIPDDITLDTDDITLDRNSFISPDKSVGLKKLREFRQIFEEKQNDIKTLLVDVGSIVEKANECFFSEHECTSLEVEHLWFDYSTLRDKRDILIRKINADAERENSAMVKYLISEYDKKENVFYKIICQKIAYEYHNGGIKNCKSLDKRPVSYLYKKLVEDGRSLSKFFNTFTSDYSDINKCLDITEPTRSLKSRMSILSSKLRNTITGNTVKREKYGGKNSTKNRLRKKGRKVTKRRKTVKRRKHSKK